MSNFILEEAAEVTIDMFNEIIVPLMNAKNTSLIPISTLQSKSNTNKPNLPDEFIIRNHIEVPDDVYQPSIHDPTLVNLAKMSHSAGGIGFEWKNLLKPTDITSDSTQHK